jgi:hypothetical protein
VAPAPRPAPPPAGPEERQPDKKPETIVEMQKRLAAQMERRGQVLVPGNPALIQDMVDLDHDVLEMLFDFRFTDEQRRESQRLLVEDWKSMPLARKQEWVRNVSSWAKPLPTLRPMGRNIQRASVLPGLLTKWLKEDASERERWLLKLYEETWKPGSARNPVLVEGDPPLTQQMVNRYCDYVESMLDLSLSGGFSVQQRKVLQDYFVSDWKKMSAPERSELLADLKTWADATGSASVPKVKEALGVLRPKHQAQLSTARDNQRSQWLLAIAARERQTFETLSAIDRMKHQTLQKMAENMTPPSGHYEYNGATGRYDRWVPDR